MIAILIERRFFLPKLVLLLAVRTRERQDGAAWTLVEGQWPTVLIDRQGEIAAETAAPRLILLLLPAAASAVLDELVARANLGGGGTLLLQLHLYIFFPPRASK